jgi:choline dehydrogenase
MTPAGHGVGRRRGRLRILFGAVTTRILFAKKKHRGRLRPVGVVFTRDNKTWHVRARRAVVLAGGINSSRLLQLSGIGPRTVLDSAGIRPRFVNANVGQHLQNHPTLYVTLLAGGDNGIPPGAAYAYCIANAYLPAVGSDASAPRYLQILFDYFPTGTPALPVPLVVMGFVLLTPLSEGSVNVQSDSTAQLAAADDGFYSNAADLDGMTACVQTYIHDILTQLAIVGVTPVVTDPINLVILSGYATPVVQAYIRNNTNLGLDIHHFASHCKMATRDQGGVVDGNTRVYGTHNLFVTDCAICPSIPDINTTGPAMMIGWRSAAIIRDILSRQRRRERRRRA